MYTENLLLLLSFHSPICFLFWTKTKSGFVWCVQYCRLRPEFGFKISSWEEWPVLKIVWPRLSSLTRLTSANSTSPFPLFRWGAKTGSLSKYLFKADFKHIVVGTLFVWNPSGDIYELTSSEGANSRMAYHHLTPNPIATKASHSWFKSICFCDDFGVRAKRCAWLPAFRRSKGDLRWLFPLFGKVTGKVEGRDRGAGTDAEPRSS